MLSDFLTLETYFGPENAAQYFDDIARHYGTPRLKRAIENGDITCRTICIGPDCGRTLTWLTDQGRIKALH